MTSNGHERAKPLRTGDPHALGDYRIEGRLGRGGMGTVYLARDASDHFVAVKLIHPDISDDKDFRLRFAREVEAARRVARFSTAGVLDARLDGDPLFIVSEYVPGPNLAEAIASDGPMRGGTLESLAMGVAAALTAIHRAGVIHRDLKPANVLLSSVGPKVIDFGIARAMDDEGAVTRSSQLMGTPAYLAPELISGGGITPASDIFSWGCLVAFAGTGRAPFDAQTVPAVLHLISSAPPNLDGLDPKLHDVVLQALEKEPTNRPTAQQLLNRLVGQEDPTESTVDQTVVRSWTPPSTARPGPAAGLAAGAAAGAIAGGAAAKDQAEEGATESLSNSGPAEPAAGQVPPPAQVESTQQASPPTQSYTQPGAPPFGPSGPQQPPYGPPASPPAGPSEGSHPAGSAPPPYGPPSGPQYAAFPPPPGMQSPPGGQPAYTQVGPSGPGGPGGPGGPRGGGQPSSGTPPSGAGRGRRRALAIGSTAAALVLIGGVAWGAAAFLGDPEFPEGITVYTDEFDSTGSGWGDSYDPEFDPEDDEYGYTDDQFALRATADDAPYSLAYAAYSRTTPENVGISFSASQRSGPDYAQMGAFCQASREEDADEDKSYSVQVNLDGSRAQIRRNGAEEGASTLAETTEPIPDFTDGRDKADEDTPNRFRITCERLPGEAEDEEIICVRLWINDEFVLEAIDDQPLPSGGTGLQVRRDGGGSGGDAIVYFDDYTLTELQIEEASPSPEDG